MRKILFSILLTTFIIACTNTKRSDEVFNAFANAKWIAFEQLDDSMRVVPGIHGSGDNLGEKCLKRSTIPMFRKEFNETGEIANASINITGLGHYELYINGQKIGDRFLSPGWSSYQKRIFYNTYDITEFLKKGDNVLGVMFLQLN